MISARSWRYVKCPGSKHTSCKQTGLSHRTFFRRKRLEPLIEAKLIRMTRPDEPNHPDQAYVVTDAAIAFLNAWRTQAGREGDS